MDPDFQAIVSTEVNVIDNSRGSLRIGWEEVYIEDGKIVEVTDGYGDFAEKSQLGSSSNPTSASADILL